MTDLGMIDAVIEEKMKIVDGVVMTKGTCPQEEISLREKWMTKDLKLSVPGVKELFSYVLELLIDYHLLCMYINCAVFSAVLVM